MSFLTTLPQLHVMTIDPLTQGECNCGRIVMAIEINRLCYLPIDIDDVNLVLGHDCIRVLRCSIPSRQLFFQFDNQQAHREARCSR